MNYFTEQNDLNKLDGISPKGPGFEKGKASILEMFVTSIINVKSLAVTSLENRSKFVAYVIFIAFFAAIMSFGVPTASKIFSFGGFRNLFLNVVPEFKSVDGVLEADQQFEMKAGVVNVLFNTDIESFERTDFDHSGTFIAIGSKDTKMISVMDVDDETTYNVFYVYNNRYLFPDGFDNESLVMVIPFIYISFMIIFVIEAALLAMRYLLLSVIYAFTTRTLTMLSKLTMTFMDSFRLAFMAQTIGIILVNTVASMGNSLYEIIASGVGVIITFIVISKAMSPHMLDDDDLIDKLMDRFGKDDDDDDSDDNEEDDEDGNDGNDGNDDK